jgi:hypothetical protein
LFVLALIYQNKPTMINQELQNRIKVGDFISAQYACQCVSGIVTKVYKSKVIVNQYIGQYNGYTSTEKYFNITKSRIYRIGLNNVSL